jgi:hypothetical protein
MVANIAQKQGLTIIHPSVKHEVSLLDRSVEMAEAAFDAIMSGATEAKNCNVMLGAGRVLQGAARQRLTQRLSAGRLAMQEARLVEQSAA